MRLYEEDSYSRKRVKPKNYWSSITANFLANLLGDIYQNQETLLSCYSSQRKQQYDETEYPEILKQYCKEYYQGNGYNSPFIIYGPPGIGKTTYIAHKLETLKADDFDLIYFIFDLRETTDFSKVSTEFYFKLNNYLKDYLDTKVYREKGDSYKLEYMLTLFKENLSSQIIDFDKNDLQKALNDSELREKSIKIIEERYLIDEKLVCIHKIRYLRNKYKTQIAFVIDNFDHFEDYKSTHAHVYALSKEIISDFNSPCFLPMRNNTLLDSYDIYGYRESDKARTKHLSGLEAQNVLEKRFNYIASNITKRVKSQSGSIEIDSAHIEDEISNVLKSIVNNSLIVELVHGLSGNNTRTLLWLMELALQSGHLDTSQSNKKDECSTYKAFLKACSYCNHLIYTPKETRTPILNMFDNGGTHVDNSFCFFSRIRLLQILNEHSSDVKTTVLLEKLESIGYSHNVIIDDMKSMLNKGLIREFPYLHSSKTIRNDSTYKITSIGRFYVEKLIFNPIYFEVMIPSTLFPKEFNGSLKVVTEDFKSRAKIKDKYDHLLKLLNHMNKREQSDLEFMRESGNLSADVLSAVISTLKRSLKKQWDDRYFKRYYPCN